MKTLFLTFLFFLSAAPFQAQSNILKYRVLAFPIPIPFYATALGYERIVNEKVSLQFLVETNGISYATFDASTDHEIVGLLEIKRRFGKYQEEVLKTAYVSAFLELGNTNVKINYLVFEEDKVLTNINRKGLNLGIGLGKHCKIGKRTYLDLYLGGKYKLVIEKSIFILNNREGLTIEKNYPHRWGVRTGFTIGYLLQSK